jgi:TPR repeat protein
MRGSYEQQRFSDAAKSWGQAALLHHAASHALGRTCLRIASELSSWAAAGAAMDCAHSKGALGLCNLFDGAEPILRCPDTVKGLALGRESAASGSCFGQFVVRRCHHWGAGVAQNHTEAVRWYGLAAAQGHAGAQSNLGFMFHHGSGVAQDRAEAIRWYRLAAAQGYARAQYNLGGMVHFGQGAPQDKAEAVRWYSLAAAQGHSKASEALARLRA